MLILWLMQHKSENKFVLSIEYGASKILNEKPCYTAQKDNFELDFNSYLR